MSVDARVRTRALTQMLTPAHADLATASDAPAQLTSKAAAVVWLCRVHNIVNARLDKPAFDCSTVRARWKCGCPSEV